MSLLLQEKLLNEYLSANNVTVGGNLLYLPFAPISSVLFILIQCLVISGMVHDLVVLIAIQTLDSFFFEAGNFLRRLVAPYVSKKFDIFF